MKKIVLTAAALLAISGSAFANGSDRYGSSQYDTTINKVGTAVDSSYTASINKSVSVEKQPVLPGADRNLFGNN